VEAGKGQQTYLPDLFQSAAALSCYLKNLVATKFVNTAKCPHSLILKRPDLFESVMATRKGRIRARPPRFRWNLSQRCCWVRSDCCKSTAEGWRFCPGLALDRRPSRAAPDGNRESARGKLRTVEFPTSCDQSVQKDFERAAMLHSFWYDESERAFSAIAAKDPECAMAYLGVP
jgi:hypothetical protein